MKLLELNPCADALCDKDVCSMLGSSCMPGAHVFKIIVRVTEKGLFCINIDKIRLSL